MPLSSSLHFDANYGASVEQLSPRKRNNGLNLSGGGGGSGVPSKPPSLINSAVPMKRSQSINVTSSGQLVELSSSGSSSNNIMGVLQCRIKSRVLEFKTGYKKRFVILNVKNQSLSIYKNDQSLSPLVTYKSDRLRNVHYAAEKNSRFFQVIIRTHGEEQIRLLFETWEERDRWGKGLAEVLDHFDTFNRRHSTMQLVERLCAAAGRKLHVGVSVTHEHFLEHVPDTLLHHVPEAVEKVIDTIQQVVTRAALFRPPSEYQIVVLVTYHHSPGVPSSGGVGVQYDPSGRCVVLHVLMKVLNHKEMTVEVVVPQYSDVESIAQSRIFRNPLIERWLVPEENQTPGFQKVHQLLPYVGQGVVVTDSTTSLKTSFGTAHSSLPFLTFQWDQQSDLLGPKEVQEYVKKFINDEFFEKLAEEMELGIRMLMQDMLYPVTQGFSSPLEPMESPLMKLFKGHISGLSIRIDYEAVRNHQAPHVLLCKTPQYNEECRAAFLLNCIFSSAFANHSLESSTVMPREFTMGVSHPTYHIPHIATLNTLGSGSFVAEDQATVSNQIFRAGMNVRLSRYMRSYRRVLREVATPFDVIINWNDLFQSYAALSVSGAADGSHSEDRQGRRGSTTTNSLAMLPSHVSLLFMVQDVVEAYRVRLKETILALKGLKCRTASGVERPLVAVMERYVRCITVDFCILKGGSPEGTSGFATLTPSVRRGVLRDVMLCEPKDVNFENSMLTLSPSTSLRNVREPNGTAGEPQGGNIGVRSPTHGEFEIGEMRVKAAASDLSGWCAQFFAKGLQQSLLEEVDVLQPLPEDPFDVKALSPGRRRRRHRRRRGDDHRPQSRLLGLEEPSMDDGRFDSDSDSGTASSLEDEDRIGDSVAIVRRDEVETIPLHQVRTMVYDSQGDDGRLKIGLEDITMAVNSLKTAKPGLTMFLHDVTKILIVNLAHLREMFQKHLQSSNWLLAQHRTTHPSVTVSVLTVKKAVVLLNDYCEYEESAECVEEVCRMYCRLRRPEKLVAFSAHLPLSVILWHFCLLEREMGGRRSMVGNSTVSNTSFVRVASSFGGARDINMSYLGSGASNSNNNNNSNNNHLVIVSAANGTPANPSSFSLNCSFRARLGAAQDTTAGLPGGHPNSVSLPVNSEVFPILPAARHFTPHPSTLENLAGDTQEPVEKVSAGCCWGSTSTTEAPSHRSPPSSSLVSHEVVPKPRDEDLTTFRDITPAPGGTLPQSNPKSLHNFNAVPDHLEQNLMNFSSNGGTMGGVEQPLEQQLLQDNKTLLAVYSECIDQNHSRVVRESRTFDFSVVADIALNLLLPMELMAAQRARRVGLLFGLDRTGKTLIGNCLRGCARPTVATVGLMEQIASFEQWILVTHELGGRECFRRNWIYYLQRAPKLDFLMFVIDAQNRVSFAEARRYLYEVLHHYPSVPLLIIFNNYPQMDWQERVHKPIDELERRFQIPQLRKREPKRCILVVTCDITLVHSSNKNIPATLYEGLRGLSRYWNSITAESEKPSMPKLSKNCLFGENDNGVGFSQEGTASFSPRR